MSVPAAVPVGFYGKLPSHGDFLRRRVAPAFLGVWDPWLQRTVTATREALGEAWLDTYLTSPIWRFALTPGVCGSQVYAGVLMPSVDAVGRYFPLTLVAELPGATVPALLAAEQSQWFERLETLALSALDSEDSFELERFDREVEALGAELAPGVIDGGPVTADGRAVCCELEGLEGLLPAMLGVLGGVARAHGGPYSLWWSEGSRRVRPCWSLCPGLPEGALFSAALDGQWEHHGWSCFSVGWQPAARADTASALKSPPRLRSSGLTHPGHVRDANEDAFLESPANGIWAVADGVGGQEAGAMASRMVVDALRAVEPGDDLQERLNRARHALADVHAHLQHLAARPLDAVNSASTVAALLAGEAGCGYLWAGDSRIYRLRGGSLERCTRDHSVVQDLVDSGKVSADDARGHAQANVITRAVGSGSALALETGFGELLPGDRFLLCSDGVHGVLSDADLATALDADSCAEACRRVLDRVLANEARDNATAVVVDVLDGSA